MDEHTKEQVRIHIQAEIKRLFIPPERKPKIMSLSYFSTSKTGVIHLVRRSDDKALCSNKVRTDRIELSLIVIDTEKVCKNCLKLYHNSRRNLENE